MPLSLRIIQPRCRPGYANLASSYGHIMAAIARFRANTAIPFRRLRRRLHCAASTASILWSPVAIGVNHRDHLKRHRHDLAVAHKSRFYENFPSLDFVEIIRT